MHKSHLEDTTSSVAALMADSTCSPVNGQSYECSTLTQEPTVAYLFQQPGQKKKKKNNNTENELKDEIMTEEFKKINRVRAFASCLQSLQSTSPLFLLSLQITPSPQIIFQNIFFFFFPCYVSPSVKEYSFGILQFICRQNLKHNLLLLKKNI